MVTWNGVECQQYPTKTIVAKLFEVDAPIIPKEVSSYIWSIKIPPRVHLTLWMASLEKLKTGDFFVDKHLIDPSQAQCPFCNSVIESNSHVLFTCQFSWSLWMMVLNWWGIAGVLPSRCIPFIQSWKRLAPGKRRRKFWSLVMGCVLWSIWFERNRAKFDGRALDLAATSYTMKIRICTWAKEFLGLELVPDMSAAAEDMLHML